MKIKNKINKSNTKLTKKSFLLGTMATILCSVPLAIGMTEIGKNVKNFSLNSQQFASLDSAVSYAKENSQKITKTLESDGSKWEVILNNGEIKTFNSPEEMRNALLDGSTIKEETYISNIDINKYVDSVTGELNVPNNLDFVKGDKINDSSKTIYKGKNSQIYIDETSAKKSLFETSEAYNFNGLYFKTKNDLKEYLEKELVNKNEQVEMNSIVLKGPNGIKSNAINLKSKNVVSEIDAFIQNNTEKAVSYLNSETKESVNITKNNVSKVLSSINTKDLGLQHIQSNQGESRYVIDNNVNDQYDLIGPYFYKGNLDIGSFMNKSMWKKVNGVSKQVYEQSEVDKVIGSFFSSIINDDNAANINEFSNKSSEDYNKPQLFRTPLMVGEQGLDDWFFSMIGGFNSGLKNDIITTNTNLMQGKKYNTFYKLPIMYTFILQRLFSLKAPQKIVDQTINYFYRIGDFIQKSIETVVLDDSLLIGKKGQKFNVNDLFHIGNSEFDTNTSIEYFMNELKTEYPQLVGAMSTYMGAVNNIYTTGGLTPYEGYNQVFLKTFGIMDTKTFDENQSKYRKIYDTFSALTYDDLIKNFVKHSKIPGVSALNGKSTQEITAGLSKIFSHSDLSLNDYLTGIGVKNTMMYNLATAALKQEIDEYNKTKLLYAKGYLEKLYSYGKLEYFVQWVNDNPQFEVYQVYLAILIDARQNLNIFNDRNSIVNNFTLASNLTRLSFETLAFTFLTSEIITKLYFAYDMSTLGYTLRTRLSDAWWSIKNLLPDSMRTWNVNARTSFKFRKWTTFNVFTKIEKGLNLISSAAPIFGAAFLAFEIFNIVYNLLKVETTTNYYVYTTADGTEFIWNGGRTVSRFFGFDVKETSGINNMQLVQPIQVTLPQLEEYYYFDGIKYYDPSQAKKAYINYLLDNESSLLSNKNFSYKYIFASDIDDSDAKSFDSIESLKNDVFTSLGIEQNQDKFDIKKINFDSEYISDIGYKFGNISSFDPNSLNEIKKQEFVNNIVDNIRETLFVKLPQHSNGFDPIAIPGKVWSKGSVVEDNTSEANKYLISNKANEVNANGDYLFDKQQGVLKAKDELEEKFMTQATVNSKTAFVSNNFSSVIASTTYDNLKTDNLKTIKIYTVFKPGLGLKKFIDKTKAEKYAMNYKKVTKKYSTYEEVSYVYNGMYFANEDSLRSWIQSKGY